MLTSQHTQTPTTPEEPFRYTRSETVRILHDHLDPDHAGQSRRAFAEAGLRPRDRDGQGWGSLGIGA